MKNFIRSFAGGEITPEMFSRLDLAKFQTGLELCLNFEIRPHGPAVNRAGFEFVAETKDSSKRSVLIPFIYSTDQAYALEFGDQYVRFHTEGASVLETGLAITGVTQAATGVLTYTGSDPSNGDTMYVSGIVGMTQLNGRYVKVANVNAGANTFELNDLNGVAIDTTGYTAWSSGGTVARVYTIASAYTEANIDRLNITQSQDVLTLAHVSYKAKQLSRLAAASWAFADIAVTPAQVAPVIASVTPGGAGAVSYSYTVTSIASENREESLAAAAVTNAACQDLSVAGAQNTVAWAAAAGALRYNVYRLRNGLYGYIGQTEGTAFVDNNITPDVSLTPPIQDDPISTASNYPGAVAYYQGRRWFAGSSNKKQNVWATRSGTESNLTYSIPTKASDAITARLTSQQANTILHLVPAGNLLALTSGAEWIIDTGGVAGPVTPSNIDYRTQGNSGSSYVRPCLTNNSLLYAQDRGGRVREIQFSWESQKYTSKDVSLMAPHLFDGYTIVSMAFVRAPYPTLWVVRSDGKLLGMTYIPEHEITAWHQHDTDGEFESVCAIPEGDDDVLYAIIKRTINGNVKRYIERKRSRSFTTASDVFIVDSGLSYSGAATTILGGFWHLIGETVSILADGAVEPQQVVAANGTITLDEPAEKVSVGLPITSKFKTLPMAMEIMAFGQGTKKNVNECYLRILETGIFKVGPSFTELREPDLRTNEPYGSPPDLVSGMISVTIDPNWSHDGPVCIQQSDPLPVTISGLIPDIALGG